jgi:hypothetical protein
MVSGAMGLLDDAIREHLELKRRRGADPGEVAREQREALDSLPSDEHATPDHDAATAADTSPASEAPPSSSGDQGQVGSALVDDAPPDLPGAHQWAPNAELSNGGQETAELDMRSVLNEDQSGHVADESPAGPVVAGPADSSSVRGHPEENSLEWQVPGDAPSEPHADEQHRADEFDDDRNPGEGPVQAPVEVFGEETIDVLRDTPEQERLRFDQRPPGDLDPDR